MKTKKNHGVKILLSILCVIFALAFTLLSVAKLTVFNESYFTKQTQSLNLNASLADELNQKLQSKIPVSIDEENTQKLEDLTNSIVEQVSATLIENLYHYEQWEQNVDELKDNLTQTVTNALEQSNISIPSAFSSAIKPAVNSIVDEIMSSSKVQKLHKLSNFLNRFNTPVTIGLFVCGIILALLVVLLYALQGTKGIVISFIVSAILLALCAIIAFFFLPDMQSSSKVLQTLLAQYKDSLVKAVALSSLFSLAGSLVFGLIGLVLGKAVYDKQKTN